MITQVSPLWWKGLFFVCLSRWVKKKPLAAPSRECFPLEREANTRDGFTICRTMYGWEAGRSHRFVTNTCAYGVADYKSRTKESLRPLLQPTGHEVCPSARSLAIYMETSAEKEKAKVPGARGKIASSDKEDQAGQFIACLPPDPCTTHACVSTTNQGSVAQGSLQQHLGLSLM